MARRIYVIGDGSTTMGFGTSVDTGFVGVVLEENDGTKLNGEVTCGTIQEDATLLHFTSGKALQRMIDELLKLKTDHF